MIMNFLIATDDLVFFIVGIICGVIMLGYGLYGIKELSSLNKILISRKKEKPIEVDLYKRKKVLTFSLIIVGISLAVVSSLGILVPLDGIQNIFYFVLMILLLLVYLVVYKIYAPKTK